MYLTCIFVMITLAKASICFNIDAQYLFSFVSLSYHLKNPNPKITKVKKDNSLKRYFIIITIFCYFLFNFLSRLASFKQEFNVPKYKAMLLYGRMWCQLYLLFVISFLQLFAQLNTFQHNSPSAPFIGRPDTYRVYKTKSATKKYFLEVTWLIKLFY